MSPRYLFKFVLHMFAFSVLLGISMIVADNSDITFPVKLLISLLPVFPFLIAIHTLFQHLKSLDEMHHRINQESVIYSLASVAIIAVILGVLEINEIIPHIPIIFFPVASLIFWAITQIFVTRRYS